MEVLLVRLLDQTVQVDLSWFQVNVLQPRMVENVFQGRPVRGAHGQAPLDEVLALERDAPSEEELASDDVLVLLEGDVPTHHVVEQDTQRPDGG